MKLKNYCGTDAFLPADMSTVHSECELSTALICAVS